jgi:hypothetical protein
MNVGYVEGTCSTQGVHAIYVEYFSWGSTTDEILC